jgi:hypothetical protein
MTEIFKRERTARTNTIVTNPLATKSSFTARIEYLDGHVISRSFWDLGDAFTWLDLNG